MKAVSRQLTHHTGRRRVLDAALVCFVRDGLSQTTLSDVEGEAHLRPGAVQPYFASKDALIEAIFGERYAAERELIARRGRQAGGLEALRRLAYDFLGKVPDESERLHRRLRVQIWAEALRNPIVSRLVHEGINGPLELLTEQIRAGQSRGDIPAGFDPEAAARALIALFHGFVLQQCWDPRLDSAKYLAAIERMIEALIEQMWMNPGSTITSRGEG